MLTVMGDHGCRWIVIPAETVVFVVLVVPIEHGQDCGACSQGSRVELYVYYRVSLEVETLVHTSHVILRGMVWDAV